MRVRCGNLPIAVTAMLLPAAAPLSAQLDPAGNHRIFQNQVGGAIEAGDRFGDALATGDFNGDGRDDLAIGTPEEDLGAVVDAGAVYVIYGSAAGLGFGAVSPILLHQDVDGVEGEAETGDRFGSVLLAGDFNGDGRDELVVGIPDEDVGALVDVGAIQVFLGTAGGLTTLGDVLWTRGTFGSLDDIEGARFGAALATGFLATVPDDPRPDLIVGIPASALAPEFLDEGSILWIPGSASGLDPSEFFHALGPSDPDRWGSAIAIGDFDGDNAPGDVAIGAPLGELWPGGSDEGVVRIAYESGGGYQTVPLGPGPGSHFGSTIVIGDFLGTGYDQMLLGAPDADVDVGDLEQDAGAVILYDGRQHAFDYITQDYSLVFDFPEPFDHFGRVLAAGDFDDDGFDDAAFGVPFEDLPLGNAVLDTGIVQVLYGSATGFGYHNNQTWWFDLLDFGLFADDNFGAALAAGDFDGDGADDLAIGAPGAFWSAAPGTGVVQILYSISPVLFADGFELGNASAWSSISPGAVSR